MFTLISNGDLNKWQKKKKGVNKNIYFRILLYTRLQLHWTTGDKTSASRLKSPMGFRYCIAATRNTISHIIRLYNIIYINCIQTFSEISTRKPVSLLSRVQTTHIYINQIIYARTRILHTFAHIWEVLTIWQCIGPRRNRMRIIHHRSSYQLLYYEHLAAAAAADFILIICFISTLYSYYLPIILQCGMQSERHESGTDWDCG